jgi:DNA-directed RNA polymerase subunit H (RpoH/RPB5)
LSEEEVEEVKIKYNINKLSQLPEISRFDPVAQVIGIRPGQVCEIIRSSKTAVNSKYYRVCIQ